MKVSDFYLYSSNEATRWYLSGRTIGCDEFLPRRDFTSRPIAHVADNHLFLTHLMLDRSFCFSADLDNSAVEICPVVLSFDLTRGRFPGWLVSAQEGKQLEFCSDISEGYDQKCHIGAFVQAALPFSAVKSIGFYNSEESGTIHAISPDLWYPTDLYTTLDKDKFIDSLEIGYHNLRILAQSANVSTTAIEMVNLLQQL